MDFVVTRVSQHDEWQSPCPDATPRDYTLGFGLKQFPHREWRITVADLDALLAFVREHGDVIVSRHGDDGYELTIYDGFVE